MRRREVVELIVGAAAAWPLGVRAQQPANQMRLVAVLTAGGEEQPHEAVFRKRLAELGWQEGRNIKIEIRRAETNVDLARDFATELVAMKPDVFLVTNSQMAQLIMAKTRDIPIVFIFVPDPIGSGLIANFARPGGNVTGFTNFDTSVAGKWLEFLKDVVPGLNRVAVILDAVNPTAAAYEKAIEAAAPTFPMQVTPASLRDAASIDTTIETFAHEPGGLVVPPSAFSVVNRDRIIAVASRYRLPAMYPYSDFPSAGGLMSYGFNRSANYQAAASYIDRILKGERVSDLPVQTPTKFELVINLKTAKTLGLTVPQSMLLVADEVIE
jgi:putative tryptophan/tyrosine transport system substrate-binding protein